MTEAAETITVWLLHEEGRWEIGHDDAARAWAEANALPMGTHDRTLAFRRFNPVEINIRAEFERLAVAKWEQRTGLTGVCVVQHHGATSRLPIKRFESEPPYTRLPRY